jgi:hypothetical protein
MLTYRKQYITKKKIYNKLKNNQKGGNLINISRDFMLKYNELLDKVNDEFCFMNTHNISRKIPITQISNPSLNGSTYNITYEDIAGLQWIDLVLKVSNSQQSDNTYYEYYVGNCINEFKKLFPNFVHTFCYVKIDSGLNALLRASPSYNDYDNFTANTDFKVYKDNELINIDNIKIGCTDNAISGLLIQSCGKIDSYDFFTDMNILSNINKHFFDIQIQVYSMLVALGDSFTHYDLHGNNVMIYNLGAPIQIIYYIGNTQPVDQREKIIIHTQYMPILIDYGRAHVKCLKKGILSKFFFDVACDTIECNPTYGTQLCKGTEVGLRMETVTKYSADRKQLIVQEEIDKRDNTYPKISNKTADTFYFHDMMRIIPDDSSCKQQYLRSCPNDKNPWLSLKQQDPEEQKDSQDQQDPQDELIIDTLLPEHSGPSFEEYIQMREQQNVCKINTINDVYAWLRLYYNEKSLYKNPDYVPRVPTLNIYLAGDREWNYTP